MRRQSRARTAHCNANLRKTEVASPWQCLHRTRPLAAWVEWYRICHNKMRKQPFSRQLCFWLEFWPPGCFSSSLLCTPGGENGMLTPPPDSVAPVTLPAPPPIRKLPACPSPSCCPGPRGQHLQGFLELMVWQVWPRFRLWRHTCSLRMVVMEVR